MKSGQILILVLLVIVVVLAVGLSVASRNITNLRTATQTEQSQRAFTAAEGGVEDVLSQLSTLAGDAEVLSSEGRNFILEERLPESGVTGTVNVKGSRIFDSTITLGNVGQIKLFHEDGSSVDAGRQIRIEWARADKPNESSGDGPASLEITQVFGSPPSYDQTRYFLPGIDGRSNEDPGTNPPGVGACPAVPPGEFVKCVQITTLAETKILRIKPFWADATVRVSGVAQLELPVQTYEVTSTASTDIGVTRRVQVKRTALKQLPAVFDYVLFSEGNVIK